MAENTTVDSFLIRMAQCIARMELDNRDEANEAGRQIANFALANWDHVVEKYGHGDVDDLEIVERLARDVLAHRPSDRQPDPDEFTICKVMLIRQPGPQWLL
jgi:hypothetical protein